jgi:hypothetical protein
MTYWLQVMAYRKLVGTQKHEGICRRGQQSYRENFDSLVIII